MNENEEKIIDTTAVEVTDEPEAKGVQEDPEDDIELEEIVEGSSWIKKNWKKAAVIAAIALLVFARWSLTGKEKKAEPEAVKTETVTVQAPAVTIAGDAEDIKGAPTNPFSGRYVTYQGITDINPVGTTQLVNPAGNDEDVYIEFVVVSDDIEVYRSDLIPAGKAVSVDFPGLIGEGEHKVLIVMNPYLDHEGEFLKCPVNNAIELTANI